MKVKVLIGKIILRVFILLMLSTSLVRAMARRPNKADLIDRYIRERLSKSNIPGLAIAVIHFDTVVIAKGYGNNSNGQQINSKSPFAIASLSKGFTAMAVLQLAQAKKLNLDDPVIKYIPAFLPNEPMGDKVTVRQLLHQIGGMADRGYPEFTIKDQPDDLNEAMVSMRTAQLTAQPGRRFQYHNPNYQVLAKVVEVASGEKFANYLQGHIFTPLGMLNTYNVANTKNATIPKGSIYLGGYPVAANESDWFVDGAAGIISNADDMAKWLSAQLKPYHADSTILLSNKYLKLMQSPPAGSGFSYGMGWITNQPAHVLYHSGIWWTYSSQEMIMTDSGYGIVLLVNSGENLTTDYYSFIEGIREIIANKTPDTGTFPIWLYRVGIIGLVCLIIFFGIRRMARTKQWYQHYLQRAKWRFWPAVAVRVTPLLILLALPYLVTVLSGRVLSWPRIALMFADVVVVLGLLAIMNLIVVIVRVGYLMRRTRKVDH